MSTAGRSHGARVNGYLLDLEHPVAGKITVTGNSTTTFYNTVNITTWQALGTRNGGEVISSDAY